MLTYDVSSSGDEDGEAAEMLSKTITAALCQSINR